MELDWNTVILAVLAALPPTIMAWAAYTQARNTHKSVNSRMDELLAAARAAATAEATIAEKAAQKSREGIKAAAILEAEKK